MHQSVLAIEAVFIFLVTIGMLKIMNPASNLQRILIGIIKTEFQPAGRRPVTIKVFECCT